MVVHIISRFVNREYRVTTDQQRSEYLGRVASSLRNSDWVLFGYALMSTHIHWATIAGYEPLSRFIQPLHSGFALWLNRTQGKLGPVFADRPRAVVMRPRDLGRLLAYIHNNPVRAGVVTAPQYCTWTSHRAYAGLDASPSWLAVGQGLHSAGFDTTARGRQQFHQFVCERSGEREPVLCGDSLAQSRVDTRFQLDAPIELATPHLTEDDRLESAVTIRPGTPLRARWNGTPEELLSIVAKHTGISVPQLQSRERSRAVVCARRVALIVGHRHLSWTISEVGACLGISRQSAGRLIRSQAPDSALAESLAARLASMLSPS